MKPPFYNLLATIQIMTLQLLMEKNTHHGLGSFAIANGKCLNSKFTRQAISREKKQKWSDIASNKGIQIKQYNSPDVPA